MPFCAFLRLYQTCFNINYSSALNNFNPSNLVQAKRLQSLRQLATHFVTNRRILVKHRYNYSTIFNKQRVTPFLLLDSDQSIFHQPLFSGYPSSSYSRTIFIRNLYIYSRALRLNFLTLPFLLPFFLKAHSFRFFNFYY